MKELAPSRQEIGSKEGEIEKLNKKRRRRNKNKKLKVSTEAESGSLKAFLVKNLILFKSPEEGVRKSKRRERVSKVAV